MGWFERASAEHGRLLDALGRLEAALRRHVSAEPGASPDGLGAAVREFLRLAELEPHIAIEERDVYPHLEPLLPPEVGPVERMLEEHETARTLVSALRRALERLESGVAAAEQEVVSQGQDLVLLLRDHIRKEERVLFPLLRRFQEETCE